MSAPAQEQTQDKPKSPGTGVKDRPWELRIWTGMMPLPWLRLLVRNRFACAPRRIAMVVIVTVISLLNLVLWLLQTLFYGRKIALTKITEDPIFIIGHWRTGTTLLHELMVLDPRCTYPNTYDCFGPNHFLVSRRVFGWWLGILLPRHRPMDNMRVGFDLPQEDEFALCNMGVPSPYLDWLFANRPRRYQDYLDFRGVPPRARERWKRAFVRFLKCLTLRNPKRIVLKSPTHTARVKVLLELFPHARFVHIVRDPHVVFPSTIKTWKRMWRYHGAQVPRYEGLEEYVFATFERMYAVFEEDRKLIPPENFCEIRYEELVRDPVGQVRRIYEHLRLGEFEAVRPAIERYAAENADYRIDRYELAPQLQEQISTRLGKYMQQYGYASAPQLASP